ncbi:MAG: phosphoglyceromutase [Tepidanaerobacteraceae bacterium]
MRKSVIILLIIAIVILIIPNYAYSAAHTEKKVIMFIMDNINYEDLTNYGQENFKYFLENAALGLMNTNSGGSYTETNAYATIGSGGYAVSSAFGDYAGGYYDLFNDEPINEVYKRHTGRDMDKRAIANIDIAGLIRQNEKLNRPVQIGNLGTLLNEKGYKTALVGNESRNISYPSLNASLITMNDKGITNYGIVDKSLLIKDNMRPYGIKTNYDMLYAAYKKAKDNADFIVVQTGDTYRLNKYMSVSDETIKRIKQNIFEEVDQFLGRIIREIDTDTLFMLVVPFPSSDDISEGKRLTPIGILEESFPPGILTSATTKRDGIITNTDLAAQVLSYFEIPKNSFITGHSIRSKATNEPLKYLMRLNEISVFNYKIRSNVVKSFIGCIIVVLLLSFVFMIYLKKYIHFLKPLLIAILVTPTILLILPIFNPWNTLHFTAILIISVLIISLSLSYFLKNNLDIFIITCILSTVIILVDTFMGNPLMKLSILGYDPIVGARFYGIGNEYMGFLLGTTIIGTSALIDRYREKEKTLKIISLALYSLVLLILMAPTLGTNVGGSMAAFIGFGAAVLLFLKGSITKKDLIVLACLLILVLLTLFIYDAMRPTEKQSHIGQTSILVRQNSISAIFQIFARKLSMNYKLIRYSTWTWALFATMATLAILFKYPVGVLKEIFRKNNYLYYGFISGIIGTLSALAFNDSGVVAAAMFMIPIAIPLIMQCMDELSKDIH